MKDDLVKRNLLGDVFLVDELQKMREVSEQFAYIIHPKLKSFLESIDNTAR